MFMNTEVLGDLASEGEERGSSSTPEEKVSIGYWGASRAITQCAY